MSNERDIKKAIAKLEYTFASDGHKVVIDVCPNCRAPVLLSDYEYCPYCGQALDQENYEF